MSLEDKFELDLHINYTDKVKNAFRLGLLWNRLPEWIREELDSAYSWNDYHFKIDIIANSATSWHDGYRSLREAGWERVEAKREGGLITYIMEYEYISNYTDQKLPEEFLKTRLQYQVTLPTCRQVKTGTKEVDVFETVCDDLQEPEEEADPIADAVETAAGEFLDDINSIGGA